MNYSSPVSRILFAAGLHERRHREGEGLVPGPVRGRNGQLEDHKNVGGFGPVDVQVGHLQPDVHLLVI